MRNAARSVAQSWGRFWFQPEPVSSLAVLRLVYGLLVLAWGLSFLPELRVFFFDDGLLPEAPDIDWRVGILNVATSDAAVIATYVALLVGAACLAVGYHSRLAAVVTFIAMLSFHRRNPYVFNSGERLMLNVGFFLLLAPVGAALSVDRWRRARDRFWDMPARAPWALRMIQIQISFMYLFTAWAKVRGTTWNDGTAVWWAWQIVDTRRFAVPDVLMHSLVAVNLITWGTLAIELAMALLVWNRRLRPWVVLAGIALHVSIELTMVVGFFSLAVFVSYLAFVPPETMEAVVHRVRRRFEASPRPALRRFADAGDGRPSRARDPLVSPDPVEAGG